MKPLADRRAWVLAAVFAALGPAAVGQTGSSDTSPDKETRVESAKRRAPVVKPLVDGGVRYEPMLRARDQGFKQGGGVLAAVNVATGALLWSVQLYETKFDPDEERDVQEVYIASLRIDAKKHVLIATDERKRRWEVSLADHHVTALPPATHK